jgi:hypothetical protein
MKVVVVLAAIGSLAVSLGALAKSGSEILDEARADAQRDLESQARYELNRRNGVGSIYGSIGRSNSDVLREQAIRAAIGSVFGTCKKPGSVSGLNMDVSGILANNVIDIPEIKTNVSGGNLLSRVGDLIPTPSAVSGDKVKIGDTWIPRKDYQAARAETEAALQDVAKQQAIAPIARPALVPSSPPAPAATVPVKKPGVPVSQVWAVKKPSAATASAK